MQSLSHYGVVVEHRKDSGKTVWNRGQLCIDVTAGTIDVEIYHGLLGQRREIITFRAKDLTTFRIRTIPNRFSGFYGGVLALLVMAMVSSRFDWNDTIWHLVVQFALWGLAFRTGLVLAYWNRVPVINLAQPAADASTKRNALWEVLRRSGALTSGSLRGVAIREIVERPEVRSALNTAEVRHALSNVAARVLRHQRPGKLKRLLRQLDKDPQRGMRKLLVELKQSSSLELHIAANVWEGRGRTLAIARQIADLLQAHRFHGLLPDLFDDRWWHAAYMRELLISAIALVGLLLSFVLIMWPRLPG